MSESWPRHGMIKFAGNVMDDITQSANGLLDCAAHVDGKVREAISVLLEVEGKETAGARESDRGGQAPEEELARVRAKLDELREEVGRLAETSPPAREPGDQRVGGRSAAAGV